MALLDSLFRTEEAEAALTDRARLQGMLDFEAALACAEATCGVIPKAAAAAIGSKCDATLFDFAALQKDAAHAGNLAIPMLQQLTALVTSADATAAGFVHWGATSQDAIDTGFVLQARVVLDAMGREIERLCQTMAKMAEAHRGTVMVGRTWMQHATPTTFGAKVAGWLDAMLRHRERWSEMRARFLTLQFGGAVGNLSALGSNGDAVADALAKELKLALPSVAWHSQRDRFAELATTMGLLTGTLGKIARDISLHGQTEIGELREAAAGGRGGSSSMPHKQNPVSCAVILAAAVRVPGLVSTMLSAMVQEDERGLGGWHAEWETLPDILRLSAGGLHHLGVALPGLEVDAKRMENNLEITRGLIYAEAVTIALAAKIGKKEARQVVEQACAKTNSSQEHLRDVLLKTQREGELFSAEEISRLFDARTQLGNSNAAIDLVLAAAKASATNSAIGSK
jgi:3-carboxy-cis,cis-muconate cycloisomerase